MTNDEWPATLREFVIRHSSFVIPLPMTPAESTAKILTVLAEVAETDEVRSNQDLALYDLQILDSMKTVQLIVALGEQLGVEISPAEFEREAWATPRKLVEDVQRRLAA
jgi:D-alanine--poly(phosphoribitol) ligase subunit 2